MGSTGGMCLSVGARKLTTLGISSKLHLGIPLSQGFFAKTSWGSQKWAS